MKIEIQCNDGSGVNGYTVYDTTNKRQLSKSYVSMQPRNFYDEDLLIFLTDKQYYQFENGKNEFTITCKILSLVDDYYYKPNFSLDHSYLVKKSKYDK